MANHFRIKANGDTNICVKYGTSATMRVTVTADDMSGVKYAWYVVDENGVKKKIANQKTSTYIRGDIKRLVHIRCVASDNYNNSGFVDFTVNIKFYFEIDGTDISKYILYKGIKWTRNDIDSAKAGRNLAGTMNRGRVTTKIKLEVACVPLTQEQARVILKLIYPEYVTVHYDDPQLGERTVQFYSNNVPATFNSVATDGSLLWNDIAFPLVER